MKAENTIRNHLRFLEAVLAPNSAYTEQEQRDAYAMRQALEWVLGKDVANPTAFILEFARRA